VGPALLLRLPGRLDGVPDEGGQSSNFIARSSTTSGLRPLPSPHPVPRRRRPDLRPSTRLPSRWPGDPGDFTKFCCLTGPSGSFPETSSSFSEGPFPSSGSLEANRSPSDPFPRWPRSSAIRVGDRGATLNWAWNPYRSAPAFRNVGASWATVVDPVRRRHTGFSIRFAGPPGGHPSRQRPHPVDSHRFRGSTGSGSKWAKPLPELSR